MSLTPSPSVSSDNHDAIQTLARHFSEEVQQAYARFRQTRVPADADAVVVAVMLDHVPGEDSGSKETPPDTAGLVADLGFDSVSITEMVFFLEDLFAVRITNDEIMRVRTVGDLRAFVRKKLVALSPAASRP
ncbi:MAG: acyl carrier protein [Opitutaceae bacterium]